MARQANRIFKELYLIKKILHMDIERYAPTGDEAVDRQVRQQLHRQVREQADAFLTTLYSITHDMTFNDWQDFWLDMGIRIFEDERELPPGFWDFPGIQDLSDGEYDDPWYEDDPFSIDLNDYCYD